MLKSKLINTIATQQTDIAEQHISLAVNQLLITMSDALTQHERIEIRDFGSFCVHYRPERQARNPKTGETLQAKASYRPHFKPGKALRERVNKRITVENK